MKRFYFFDKKLNLKEDKNQLEPSLLRKNNEYNIILLAKYSSFGYYLIVPIFLGILVGFYLDSYLKTKKIFFIIGFLLGIFASFYNLKKIYQSFKK